MQRRQFLKAAAAVAGAAAGDVPDTEITAQQNHLLQLADRTDGERREYETTRNLAHIRSGLVNAELDALCDNPNGIIQTHAVRRGSIPLGFEVSTDDESVGTLVHLSAKQAETLAVEIPGRVGLGVEIHRTGNRPQDGDDDVIDGHLSNGCLR